MDLAAAVAPTTLARQRTLPVPDPLIPLLPDGALPRGRAVACGGVASTSLSIALAAGATVAGAWLAVVDVPWLGVEAAGELGVPLERLVRVDPPAERGDAAWADLVAAVLDGFEVVITRVPRRLGAGVARRVQARVQAREAVLITVGDPGPLATDIRMVASTPVWEGVEHGWGHLRGRRVAVTSSGRRIPRPRRVELWLPGPDGAVATVDPVVHPIKQQHAGDPLTSDQQRIAIATAAG
ncbi:MAG: hypothetical protein ABW122_10825 [Ilumatobacteraceae bacterium]